MILKQPSDILRFARRVQIHRSRLLLSCALLSDFRMRITPHQRFSYLHPVGLSFIKTQLHPNPKGWLPKHYINTASLHTRALPCPDLLHPANLFGFTPWKRMNPGGWQVTGHHSATDMRGCRSPPLP